jgi:hypothetical protein
MLQAKFSLTKGQLEFVDRHKAWGFPDKSSLVREAIEQLRAKLARERLEESARLYAEVYTEDDDVCGLTEAALEDWPQ